jgi:hypothetical protein
MLPVFKPGEFALVRSAGLVAGDCAVYEYEGRNLLHRVLKAGPEGVWFADDAGRLEPHLVAWKKVRGKVLSAHPLAGGLCGRLYSGLRRAISPLFI